jgi:hypothetical protein
MLPNILDVFPETTQAEVVTMTTEDLERCAGGEWYFKPMSQGDMNLVSGAAGNAAIDF